MQWMPSSLKGPATISKQYDFSNFDIASIISGLLSQPIEEPFFKAQIWKTASRDFNSDGSGNEYFLNGSDNVSLRAYWSIPWVSKLSRKGPDCKYFQLCEQQGLYHNYSTFSYGAKAAIDNMQMNVCVCV